MMKRMMLMQLSFTLSASCLLLLLSSQRHIFVFLHRMMLMLSQSRYFLLMHLHLYFYFESTFTQKIYDVYHFVIDWKDLKSHISPNWRNYKKKILSLISSPFTFFYPFLNFYSNLLVLQLLLFPTRKLNYTSNYLYHKRNDSLILMLQFLDQIRSQNLDLKLRVRLNENSITNVHAYLLIPLQLLISITTSVFRVCVFCYVYNTWPSFSCLLITFELPRSK